MLKKIIVLLLSLNITACCGQSNSLKPVESDNGIVYFSYDNGLSWKNASAGIPQKVSIGLGGIAVSTNLLGAATKEYGVYLYDFQKNVWTQCTPDTLMIKSNMGSLFFFKNAIFVGTQYGGIYYSNDRGKTWVLKNAGLGNLTIRRFAEIDNKLYAATNGGLYIFDEAAHKWELKFDNNSLQVNGITQFKENIYIATNQGVFKSDKKGENWSNVLPNHSVHNISSDDNTLYAMTYNALLLSSFEGKTWQNIQDGLPKGLYTFNVLNKNNTVFAGQWDGIYSKTSAHNAWILSSNGLPSKFAATNLKVYNHVLIISTSERKLK
jgi:ligand-binding sensor domain-containing protein